MQNKQEKQLTPFLSPAGAWAISLGTTIGWGSLVITSNTYLSKAGPLGSVLGLLIGAAVMLIIAKCYHYMMNCFPEAGGAYTYAKEVYGYDHGFLTAWFLALTYLAVLWANATSLPLFARYFIGDFFQKGYLYSIFGYDVYIGEILLTAAAIVLAALFCMRSRRLLSGLMIALGLFFIVGIVVCFAAAAFRHDQPMTPVFVPGKNPFSQVIRIACISPWAFIGFENISHTTEEFNFPRKKIFRIFLAAICTSTLLYIFITLLSVSAHPAGYSSWLGYIQDHGNLSGIRGLPGFFAADKYLGRLGFYLLVLSLLALIITSLIGNTLALSRLFYALARDRVLPERFSELNRYSIPQKAICLIAGISLIIPFLGRTAIGWIVDVTTIGATLIYGFVSASAWKMARSRGDRIEKGIGLAGLIIMIGFGVYLLVPSLITTGSLEPESYILFVVWAVLGFIYFRTILQRDKMKRFGQSIIVWIALLSLVLFVSLVWMSQTSMNASGRAMADVREYYQEDLQTDADEQFIEQELIRLRHTNATSMLVVIGLMALSLGVLMNNYSIMSRRALESELELGNVRDMANTDPLTGVKSKHAYIEKERSADAEIRESGSEPFSIVVCDVNGLKYINDTFGHKAGDEYIRAASRLICELFGHSPVYRMGGDEFVVFLTGRDFENRYEILKTFHARVEENLRKDDVVVSAGISDYDPEADKTVHAVFERADAQMYQRKKELKSMGARTR